MKPNKSPLPARVLTRRMTSAMLSRKTGQLSGKPLAIAVMNHPQPWTCFKQSMQTCDCMLTSSSPCWSWSIKNDRAAKSANVTTRLRHRIKESWLRLTCQSKISCAFSTVTYSSTQPAWGGTSTPIWDVSGDWQGNIIYDATNARSVTFSIDAIRDVSTFLNKIMACSRTPNSC